MFKDLIWDESDKRDKDGWNDWNVDLLISCLKSRGANTSARKSVEVEEKLKKLEELKNSHYENPLANILTQKIEDLSNLN